MRGGAVLPRRVLVRKVPPEERRRARPRVLRRAAVGVQAFPSLQENDATANVRDMIPAPLQDRLEVIELPGYAEDEKFGIAESHLVGR